MAGLRNKLNGPSTGPNDLGEGLGIIAKKTAKTILDAIAAGGQYAAAGFSKILEKCGNQNPNVVASRQSLAQHHIGQANKHIKNVGTGILDAGKGVGKAVKGTGKTVAHVGSHVIDGLKK